MNALYRSANVIQHALIRKEDTPASVNKDLEGMAMYCVIVSTCQSFVKFEKYFDVVTVPLEIITYIICIL